LKQHNSDNFPWGAETVVHKGDVIGSLTSSGFNFDDGHPVCLGFIKGDVQDIVSSNEELSVNIAGILYQVEIIN